MKRPIESPVLFYICLAFISAGIGAMVLWILSRLERPIEYLVAGTFATVLALIGVWVVLVKRRWI